MGIFGVCGVEALIGSRDVKSDEHGEHVLLFLCYALVSSNAKCVHQDLCLRRLQLVRFGYPDFKKHNRTKILAPNKQNFQSCQKIHHLAIHFILRHFVTN